MEAEGHPVTSPIPESELAEMAWCEAEEGSGHIGAIEKEACIASRTRLIAEVQRLTAERDEERALHSLSLAEVKRQAERVRRLTEALERISRPPDCGCVPCTGDCRGLEALEIETDAHRDIARAALEDGHDS
jgi:plasmid stabilization system protein ParE